MTKHIDARYFFFRENVIQSDITVKKNCYDKKSSEHVD